MKKLIIFFLFFLQGMENQGFSQGTLTIDGGNRYQYVKSKFKKTVGNDFFNQNEALQQEKVDGAKESKVEDLSINGKFMSELIFWNEISIGDKKINVQLVKLLPKTLIFQKGEYFYLSQCKFNLDGKAINRPNRLKVADESDPMVIEFRRYFSSKNEIIETGDITENKASEKVSKVENDDTYPHSRLEKSLETLANSTTNLNNVVAGHETRITGLESRVLTLEEKNKILADEIKKNKEEFYDYVDRQENLNNRQKRQVKNDYDDYYNNNQYQNQSLVSYFSYGGQGYQNSSCQSFWGSSGFTLGFSVSAGYSSYQPNTVLGSNYCSGQGGYGNSGGGYTSIYNYNDYSINNSNNTTGSYNTNKTNTNSGNTTTTTTNNNPRGGGNQGGGTVKPPKKQGEPLTSGGSPTDRYKVFDNNGNWSWSNDPSVKFDGKTNFPIDPRRVPGNTGGTTTNNGSSQSRGSDNYSSGSGADKPGNRSFDNSNSLASRSFSRGSGVSNEILGRTYGNRANQTEGLDVARQSVNNNSYSRGSALSNSTKADNGFSRRGNNDYSSGSGSNNSGSRNFDVSNTNTTRVSRSNYAPTPRQNNNWSSGTGNAMNISSRASSIGGGGFNATPRMNQGGGGTSRGRR